MKVSQNGLNLIKEFEGCRLTAYQDSVGVWTIGWGTTNADKSITGTTIKSGLKISQQTADSWLEASVNNKYAPLVDKYSKYNFNQNQFDALVSFCYNIGSIDQLTAKGTRSMAEISSHILAYNKAGGKVLTGLTRRRTAEKALFDMPTTSNTYKEGQNVEINVPFYFTGAVEDDRFLYDNKTEPCWIHDKTKSLIKNDKMTARAMVCYVEGEKCIVQVFDDQFWIKQSDIAKVL